MKWGLMVGATVAAVVSSAARAELQNENLPLQLPAGYKIDFQKRQDKAQISEMVPSGENINNWTEMVTVQIFFGLNATPEQFKARMENGWTSACPAGTSQLIAAAPVRGYPSNLWAMSCPRHPGTGKPENTWVKTIKGNDSFYVVQKAFKFVPSKEQEKKWLDYLDGVSVCDTRVPARACPKGM
jgi:hypothetical protein